MRKPEKIMLTAAEKVALNELAGKVGCVARSGPTAGKPSFRVLLQEMAAGTFVLFDKRKPKKKKEWKTKGKAKIPGAPDWWGPWYGNAMGAEQAIKKSGLNRSELQDLGLRLDCNPFLSHPEVLVGKPEWPAPFLSTRPHWWWRPEIDNTMLVDEAVSRSGLSVQKIVGEGIRLSECGNWLEAPEGWTGWRHKESARSTRAENEMPDVKPLMLHAPEWFVKCPRMTAMPLDDAMAASGMNVATMALHGIRVQKISGKRFVTGPEGSDWSIDDDAQPENVVDDDYLAAITGGAK